MVYMAILAFRIESRRISSEHTLNDEKRKFELLAKNSLDLISRHNKSGDTLFASPAASAFFGCDAEELFGRGMFDRIHVPDRVLFMRTLSEAITNNEAKTAELQIQSRVDDVTSLKWIEMRCRPYRDQLTWKS